MKRRWLYRLRWKQGKRECRKNGFLGLDILTHMTIFNNSALAGQDVMRIQETFKSYIKRLYGFIVKPAIGLFKKID
jgi:hypothetical protein